jgi:hypothetical protein
MAGKRVAFDEARAREEVENGRDAFHVIAARHGISRSTLLARAKEGGWRRKHPTVPRKRRPKAEMEAVRLEAAKRLLRKDTAGRLFALIARTVQEIERRMKQRAESGAPETAAETEGDIRALNAIAQVCRKVAELDELNRKDKAASRSAAARNDDAEALRRELARRIARLGGFGEA